MKLHWLTVTGMLLTVLTGGLFIGQHVKAYDRPRFEHVYSSDWIDGNKRDDSVKFVVIHDKDTGNEIICAHGLTTNIGSLPISCFQTGRNWK